MFRVSSRETFDRGKIFYYYTLIRNVNSQPTQETLKVETNFRIQNKLVEHVNMRTDETTQSCIADSWNFKFLTRFELRIQ